MGRGESEGTWVSKGWLFGWCLRTIHNQRSDDQLGGKRLRFLVLTALSDLILSFLWHQKIKSILREVGSFSKYFLNKNELLIK